MRRLNGEKVGKDMIISVASGKGGTGKTTSATSRALSLGNVQFLDCDVGEPNFSSPNQTGKELITGTGKVTLNHETVDNNQR